MPNFESGVDFEAWLPGVTGKFVAKSYAEPTCRAPESWAALATPESVVRIQERQQRIRAEWAEGIRNAVWHCSRHQHDRGRRGGRRRHGSVVERLGSEQDFLGVYDPYSVTPPEL